MNLRFTVYGKPVPQGSMRAFMPKNSTRPIVTSDNPGLKPWRQQISQEAMILWKQPPSEKPIAIRLDFFFDKPKSAKRDQMTVKPDADKLLRSVLDSCTGVVFKDDSQAIDIRVTKQYGSPARVEILVGEL